MKPKRSTKKQMSDRRRRDLAKIHIALKQLGIDDETYRDILYKITGQRSAASLDETERGKVLKHFKALGFKPAPKDKGPYKSFHRSAKKSGMHVSPAEDRAPLLSKIGAILADLKLPWAYADGMARKMFGVDRVRWLKPEQLYKLVAALSYHQKRAQNK